MNQNTSRIGTLTLFIAIIALLAVVLMMFGARLGLWEPIVGFGYIRNYLNPIGYWVLGLGVVGFIYQRVTQNSAGATKSLIAALIGLGMLSPTIYGKINPTPRAPAIHDITTDTQNPPQFLVLDETRSGAKNSLIYAGEEVATIQEEFYPDIAPIKSELTAIEAFNKALEVAKIKAGKSLHKTLKHFALKPVKQHLFLHLLTISWLW